MTVLDSADIKRDEDFHEKYLRIDPSKVDSSDEFSTFYKENIDRMAAVADQSYMGEGTEHDLYEPILNILSRVSHRVARQININDDGDCILFHPSRLHAVDDGVEEESSDAVNEPDLVAVWDKLGAVEDVTHDKTTGIPTSKSWNTTELVSFVDVELLNPELSDRAAAYARGLPSARPDIAGLLYMTCTAEIFRFCWSDASRLVYSKQYEWDKDVHLLFYFLHTLYDAVDDLPQRDSTMQLSKEEDGKLTWIVKTAQGEMGAVRLFSTLAWGKQTWILQSGYYIIKDLWREKKMRFTEDAVLEKIHEEGYVPGVVRLCSYEEVTEMRAILESYGDALEECTSLLQLLKIGFDIVHIHQFCVMDRDSLHRDISKSNIVINPKHKPDDTKKQNPKVTKYIEQVLDPALENVKEIAMLIDWDNAALLGSGAPLTDMTGTPMYIAMAVSTGAFSGDGDHKRIKFPLISDEARALYISAYAQKRHDDYVSEINKSPFIVEPKEKVPFEHLPYLDMESVFWLYAYILCRACVGDEDRPTREYNHFVENMEHHNPGDTYDVRFGFLYESSLENWEKRLHPKLKLVAGMLLRMSRYLNVKWAYWKDDIPADHAHEMMKRLFLEAIVRVRKEGDVTINLKRARERWQDPARWFRFPLN